MNRFERNLGVVTLASMASFAVSLALTPIMTRLYAPADYGTFAVVNNVATFVATLALMSLPNVLPLESRLVKRAQVGRATVHLALLAFAASPLLVLAYVAWRPGGGGSRWAAASLPALVAAIGAHRLGQGWVNADARFGTMAAARVAHPLVAKLGAIGAALSIGAHPLALLGFEALGYAVQARIMLGAAWRRLFSPRGALSRRRWRLTAGVVRGHRDMTFYGHASALLALGEIAAESVIVAHFFSVRDAGLFSLALGIASLPVQLVALATASVIYHRFIETARARPGTIFRTVARTLSGYLLVGVPVYGVILWKGPDLFSLALGEEWRESGRLASLLAPALLLVFVLTPLSSIFRVARIQHVALTVDAVFLPIAVTTLLVSSMRLDLFGAITCLAFALCVHRLALLGACLTAARRVSAKAPTREVSACAS